MASHVVHFGIDEQGVLAALAANGYTVHECGTSIASFNDALKSSDIDAVVVEPGSVPVREEIVLSALLHRSVPWVLFREMEYSRGQAAFDLVISRDTPCSAWLKKIEQLINRSHQLQSNTKLLCEQAASLQQTARSVTRDSIAGRVEGEYRRRSTASKAQRVPPSHPTIVGQRPRHYLGKRFAFSSSTIRSPGAECCAACFGKTEDWR